jgi:hypothetical protein
VRDADEHAAVPVVLMYLIAETAQHAGDAGHADILRETLDGQKPT